MNRAGWQTCSHVPSGEHDSNPGDCQPPDKLANFLLGSGGEGAAVSWCVTLPGRKGLGEGSEYFAPHESLLEVLEGAAACLRHEEEHDEGENQLEAGEDEAGVLHPDACGHVGEHLAEGRYYVSYLIFFTDRLIDFLDD